MCAADLFAELLGHYCCDVGSFVLAFPSMHGTIIWGVFFGLVSLNLSFENKAAKVWNSVDFTSPRGQLALGSRIKEESGISLELLSFA